MSYRPGYISLSRRRQSEEAEQRRYEKWEKRLPKAAIQSRDKYLGSGSELRDVVDEMGEEGVWSKFDDCIRFDGEDVVLIWSLRSRGLLFEAYHGDASEFRARFIKVAGKRFKRTGFFEHDERNPTPTFLACKQDRRRDTGAARKRRRNTTEACTVRSVACPYPSRQLLRMTVHGDARRRSDCPPTGCVPNKVSGQ